MRQTISQDQLLALKDRYVPRGVFHTAPFFVTRGEGAFLFDTEGKRYIDFASGLGAMNLGHSHPLIIQAVTEQARNLIHACFHVTMYEPYVLLAKELSELLGDRSTAFFVNSGAEAVENAVKIARHATKRKSVICFEGGFHGRTLMALTLTSKILPYKQGFGPFSPEVYRLPYPYWYRCSCGLSYSDCGEKAAEKLRDAFVSHVDPEDVACIVVEPVLGEGGFVVPPPEFLRCLAGIAREHGIVLVLDEVQAGLGRTGKMFAFEHAEIKPDIVVLAKSLGSGLPIGAVVGRADLMDSAQVGGLGGTFGGNPLACRAALQVLEILKEGRILKRASEIGKKVMSYFLQMQECSSLIGDVRGLGAMIAMELVKDRSTKEPAKDETKKILAYCHQHGLVVLKAGLYDNVIRILPPLIIDDETLEDGLKILEEGVRRLG